MAADKRRSILLLGGAAHQVPAIECAHRLGLRTVLCDYLPDNPGQYAADVFYQKSTTDRALMLEVARAEGVQGVLSFGSDAALPSAAYVAEELGLPSNPLSSVEVLSEKNLFRPYLQGHGFACPASVSFGANASASEVARLVEPLRRPLVMKPTDSSGSKGITVLSEPDAGSLAAALKAARAYSRNNVLVAEEFIERGYPHVIGGDIFVADGRIVFWGLMDCLRNDRLGGLVPVGEMYPTGLPAAELARVKDALQRLVTGLHLSFGEMNVEVIVGTDGEPYILELGGRAGGNMLPMQLSEVSGVGLVEANVRFAMGDAVLDVSFAGPSGSDVSREGPAVATYVVHAEQDGAFAGVEESPEIAPFVYRRILNAAPGDAVRRLSNGSQSLGVWFLRFPDVSAMRRTMARACDLIRVRVV